MAYESRVSFTLDTICPWTYLAYRRLHRALALLPKDCPVKFSIHFEPYQLYPEASAEGEDKYSWYKTSKYADSDEKMRMYTQLMTAYGKAEGIDFKFEGTIANTLDAHRVVQHFQEEKGEEVADKLVAGLYRRYFEEEQHPSSRETLVEACVEAGLEREQVEAFVGGDEGLGTVKRAIQEQVGNGVDAVPVVVLEGKRRDLTFVGAKEVEDYRKGLEQIIKESG